MMISTNEQCLLKFLSTGDKSSFTEEGEFISLLNKLNIEIKTPIKQSLYDIIEEYENN